MTSRLLGRSTYTPPPWSAGSIDIDDARRNVNGGQLQMPTATQSRWYLADLETAEHNADNGSLQLAGRLMAAARRDGVISGVLSTRTSGLVRLPRRFRGDPEVVEQLSVGRDSVRSLFDEMFPPSELALLAADGELLGVGVGELLPVIGRDFPVFCRLDPQYLQYVWAENRWYYLSVIGRMPITPGDGRWILHTPGGRVAPWNNGLWRALGRNYIRKDHANWHRDNWESKLAHPARVAVAPNGSTEAQKDSFFRNVLAWGINTVFGLPVGYDVRLLESNGRGADSFVRTIEDQNQEIIITIAGQTITTSGGTGFSNQDIHRMIRADLIQATADGLAYTLNTQGIPVFVALRWGPAAIETKPCVMEYDVTPPKDKNADALTIQTLATAIQQMTTALAGSGQELDVQALTEDFAIPIKQPAPAPQPGLRLVGGTDVDDVDEAVDNVGGTPDATLDAGDVAAPPTGKPAQDSALNGAQIGSLLEVVQAVVAGLIPRDAASAIIQRSFLVDAAEADAMLGSAGLTPATPTAPAPAVTVAA
jgi:hypothetical protein